MIRAVDDDRDGFFEQFFITQANGLKPIPFSNRFKQLSFAWQIDSSSSILQQAFL